MVDLHWTDLTKTPDEFDYDGFIVLNNFQWDKVKSYIDKLLKEENENMFNEKIRKYRELSGDNSDYTTMGEIGGYLNGYEKGRTEVIDKIYKYIKAECNPYGKPTINFEDGKKILEYLNLLKIANE